MDSKKKTEQEELERRRQILKGVKTEIQKAESEQR